ncbi:hypothetical protein DWG18_01200 [Lysobacter sp. TY2-98]|nr:hypothetical protein DWG18_01200 [Lysobacter sp. TY2-98]
MGHDMTADGDMPGMSASGHSMHGMAGALGPYSSSREASGTSWQPDASGHSGLHAMRGDWMLMAHGVVNAVYDDQSGPRGDSGSFASGMVMGMAQRPLGDGTLQLRAMLSPDPLMGARGYPLLLASGETANGVDRLVDRQHPHDFFMELAASVSHNIGPRSSVFVYGGLPGEPAFGPPAFMHREAIMESPEAPITHHWLDSTHISMGVVTAGVVVDKAKFEVSRFNAREPDEHRWNIETGAIDSTALRASWNPIDSLALQVSWGRFKDPEQLEPGVDQDRWSASALYAREFATGWRFAGTAAWGRKSIEHHGQHFNDDAYAVEASLKHGGWTYFGRGESTENRELVDADDGHGPAYQVGKVSIGAVRDFRVAQHVLFGVGGLYALNFVPEQLNDLYGSRRPTGAMTFVRLKLD